MNPKMIPKMMPKLMGSYKKRRYVNFRRYGLIAASVLGGIALICVAVIIFLSIAPGNFPYNRIVTIKKDMYMSQVADILAAEGIIKSPLLYKVFVVLLSGQRQVQAGDYLFDKPQSVVRVAFRTLYGLEGMPKIKVTLFEGMSATEMAASLKKSLPRFNDKKFVALAKPLEGLLFPDTYYFHETVSADEVVDLLHDTFDQKMKTIAAQVKSFGKPLNDIVIMASLVEKEATKSSDRRLIAGILWKRLDRKMPLQVDAPFYYLLGKSSAKLTLKDLTIDSPYNLYKHTGLTPAPINNPGLNAIIDTISPTASDYLYFLSGRDGTMHYASTFEGHVANKGKYIYFE